MELLVIIIVLALIFDYINGFHDAANSIATIVSTKVLTPFQAVIWAAFFNFVAFFIAKCVRIENGDGALHYFAYHSGRRDCGYCLESVHLVEGNPFLFFAHAYRRFCRSCHHGTRF